MSKLFSRTRGALLIAFLALCATLTVACDTQTGSPTATSPAATVLNKVGLPVKTAYGTYANVTPAELKVMLDNKDFFLVDVHTPPEGRLPKTDARIVFDKVEDEAGKLPSDKAAKIVLTCRSGHMSGIASDTLTRLGYTNVYNLAGGMNAWKAAGYTIIPEDK